MCVGVRPMTEWQLAQKIKQLKYGKRPIGSGEFILCLILFLR